MKTDLILAPTQIRDILKIADARFGLVSLMPDMGESSADILKYIEGEACWMITTSSDDYSTLYSYVLLDWCAEREAQIHFTRFNQFNIKEGWKQVLKITDEYIDIIHAYINTERRDVIKLAEALGFTFTIKEGIYHGQNSKKSRELIN